MVKATLTGAALTFRFVFSFFALFAVSRLLSCDCPVHYARNAVRAVVRQLLFISLSTDDRCAIAPPLPSSHDMLFFDVLFFPVPFTPSPA